MNACTIRSLKAATSARQQAANGRSRRRSLGHRIAAERPGQQQHPGPGLLTNDQAFVRVPWDGWTTLQAGAGVWCLDQALPAAAASLVQRMQGVPFQQLPASEQEAVAAACQLLQLAVTFAILQATTGSAYAAGQQPPWRAYRFDLVVALQVVAAATAALGCSAFVVAASQHALTPPDGGGALQGAAVAAAARQLRAPTAAALLGGVVLAPLYEEAFFRGFVLPGVAGISSPAVGVLVSSLLFASAHSSSTFLPEALVGAIFGLAMLSSSGNLLVPTASHALYNAALLGVAALAAAQQ